jgi:2-keto-4-pentenoate hydratase/2-oxohepta-3-ene-1,7-dioic acid hydratase in catechol pathway/pimeloyl-ACP methyl ester carboxylesterase
VGYKILDAMSLPFCRYDSSDKVDQPTHPVIFTKRATSIIPSGAEIYPHPNFTRTLDYEGEIGVIIGKSGYQIPEAQAEDYIWGYTIINDVTARERQRDHKQFFLGKSADTFCPLGPVAAQKEDLPDTLQVTTLVNGQQRQKATTKDLIFSVANLISVISAGLTIQAGDVIATGTPAGVGFGFHPPKWLVPGDEVEVTVTGLGSLKNRVGSPNSTPVVSTQSQARIFNEKLRESSGLTSIRGKKLYYRSTGLSTGKPVLFIHGLGGTGEFYGALADRLAPRRSLYLIDLEGHGLSPVPASRTLSIESFAADAQNLCAHVGIKSKLTVVAHSMGCLVALRFALDNPELVDELVLMGPPPTPLSVDGAQAQLQRGAAVRAHGMPAIAETTVRGSTSQFTQANKPMVLVAAKSMLLGQDPEGYAKACTALFTSSKVTIPVSQLRCRVLILTGTEDKISPPALVEKYGSEIPGSTTLILENVGHWHLYEEPAKVIDTVDKFLE